MDIQSDVAPAVSENEKLQGRNLVLAETVKAVEAQRNALAGECARKSAMLAIKDQALAELRSQIEQMQDKVREMQTRLDAMPAPAPAATTEQTQH